MLVWMSHQDMKNALASRPRTLSDDGSLPEHGKLVRAIDMVA
jgi:hypothetical protein